ncbi:hypothetical protein AM228_20000 [Planktothricoides sp. SR001]|nr:hypothetical protein AM228_20000 [Planktothricoides sp. SR001]
MGKQVEKFITHNKRGLQPNYYDLNAYVSLIAYLILQIVSIPEQWGNTLLDKLRYLQCCICQKIGVAHLWYAKD